MLRASYLVIGEAKSQRVVKMGSGTHGIPNALHLGDHDEKAKQISSD